MTTSVGDPDSVWNAYHGKSDGYLLKPVDGAKRLEELRKLELIA